MQGNYFWDDVNELARSLKESGKTRHERRVIVGSAFREMSPADRVKASTSLRMLLQELSDIDRDVGSWDRSSPSRNSMQAKQESVVLAAH